jgi:adenosylmethionine-8-amino-7-oxononanoate aminotransferase
LELSFYYLIIPKNQHLGEIQNKAIEHLSYHNERVKKVMISQIEKFSYCNSMFFGTKIGEQLSEVLVKGTRGEMAKTLVMFSGMTLLIGWTRITSANKHLWSEAVDAAMKMARQYFMETVPKQPRRTKFIDRHGSYHGTTWGALSFGGHVARRELYELMLLENCAMVSALNEYRGRLDGQSQKEYVK